MPDDRSPERDLRTGLLVPNRCGLYIPGHEVHYIQAIKSLKDDDRPPVPTQVIGIEGNVLSVRVGDETRRYRNHEPARVADFVRRWSGHGLVQESWSLLRLGPGNTYCTYCFSIGKADRPWRECGTGEPLQPGAGGVLVGLPDQLRGKDLDNLSEEDARIFEAFIDQVARAIAPVAEPSEGQENRKRRGTER